MIWYSFITTGIAGLALWAAWKFRKKAKKEKARADIFQKEVDRRGHVIRRMEEINAKTAKKKKKLSSGSDSDKFDASMDILQDLSRGPNNSDPA